MTKRTRVLVIGLDGATFDLIEPWSQKGYLPNLKRLMAEGCYGRLTSTMHPLTPSAWTSFMTGANQGQHNIYDFVRRRAGTYATEVLNASHIALPTLFEIASQAGRNVIAINVPYTYPPRPVRGVLVSGPFAPNVLREAVYPPERLPEIQEVVPDYFITPEYNSYAAQPLVDFKAKLFKEIELREKLSLHLMRQEDWDLCMLVFMATDMGQHAFWDSRLLESSDASTSEKHTILEIYQRVDAAIGNLLSQVQAEQENQETIVIVMSDHGAGPLRGVVNLNSWLAQKGYLRFRTEYSIQNLRTAVMQGIFRTYRQYVPAKVRRGIQSLLGGNRIYQARDTLNSALTANIDWEHTRAYALGGYGSLHLNLAGREPNGIVPRAEYESLRQELADAVAGLRDPETGQPIVKCAHRGEDLYAGQFLSDAPDLVIEWLDYSIVGGSHGGPRLPVFVAQAEADGSRLPLLCAHRVHGILIANGPGIARNVRLEGARILDMAPTILKRLGIVPPPYMDGQALAALAAPDGTLAEVVTDYSLPTPTPQLDYTPEEEATISEHLKSLGYL